MSRFYFITTVIFKPSRALVLKLIKVKPKREKRGIFTF